MKVLDGTDKAWVVELLYAFNAGMWLHAGMLVSL